MINFKTIITIAKKEFLTYFNSSTGYILMVPFLLISFFLYFRSAFIANQASLRPFFDLLPFMLLLFAPAIAMRTFAQEQKNKTLELLFAHPITETEIVLGKFFGSLSYFTVLLLSSLSLPITTLLFSTPDPGVLVAQYLGGIFVGGAFLAIGIAAATLTATQVASFLLAAAISFVFMLIGFEMVLLSVPQGLSQFVAELAILPHMNNVTRGVLDLRDLLYFITLIGAFLTVAVIKLSQRKTAEDPAARTRLNVALGLILGIGIVANLLVHRYPFQLDITANRLFTLSKGTTQTLKELPDVVTITLFTSTNLPGPVQVQSRRVLDTIRDYTRYSNGKVRLVERHPDQGSDDEKAAQEQGIQTVQFNTLGNNAFAVAAGYFGLTLTYGDKREVIPYIQNVDDLEYQLTRRIRKMTGTQKNTVALYTQIPPFNQEKQIEVLRETLQSQYELETLGLDDPKASISAQALLVYGLDSAIGSTASAAIKSYVDKGGSAVFLLENHTVNPQVGQATPYRTGLEDILQSFGIKSNQDMVYDLQLNETITLSNGPVQYLLPYPFWIKAIPGTTDFVALSGINSVSLAWTNSFELEDVAGVTQTKLLQTSSRGGSQSGVYTIAPNQIKPESFSQSFATKLVGVAATKDNKRLVVVGDSDFITDQFTQNNPENLAFASNLIDWVGGDPVIASIPRKSGGNPVFRFTSPLQATTTQYLNLFLPPLVIIGFAIWWLGRRKRLARRTFYPNV